MVCWVCNWSCPTSSKYDLQPIANDLPHKNKKITHPSHAGRKYYIRTITLSHGFRYCIYYHRHLSATCLWPQFSPASIDTPRSTKTLQGVQGWFVHNNGQNSANWTRHWSDNKAMTIQGNGSIWEDVDLQLRILDWFVRNASLLQLPVQSNLCCIGLHYHMCLHCVGEERMRVMHGNRMNKKWKGEQAP